LKGLVNFSEKVVQVLISGMLSNKSGSAEAKEISFGKRGWTRPSGGNNKEVSRFAFRLTQ